MSAFQNLLDERAGAGRYQLRLLLLLLLVDLNDGVQLIFISLCSLVVELKPYFLTLTTLFYLGTFAGSIISGALADRVGRKPILVLGSFLQFFSNLAFVSISSPAGLFFARFCYGFSYGATVVLTTSILSEALPQSLRGKGLLVLNFAVSIGKAWGIFIAFILGGEGELQWRPTFLIGSLPSLLVAIGCLISLSETARYLIATNRLQEGFSVLDQMIVENKGEEARTLTLEDKHQLAEWRRNYFEGQLKSGFSSLCSDQFRRATVCLGISWACLSFAYFGHLNIMPALLAEVKKKSLFDYLLVVCGELPAIAVTMVLIDLPLAGRKNSLSAFFLLSAGLLFLFAFMEGTSVTVSFCTRFFLKLCFQFIYPFTTQSFGTLNRTIGFGLCSAQGRLSVVLMPSIVFSLLQISKDKYDSGKLLPMCFMGVLALVGSAACHSMPRDTTQGDLDQRLRPEKQIEMTHYKN